MTFQAVKIPDALKTSKIKPVSKIEKRKPFGKPQAEVDFACVYNL